MLMNMLKVTSRANNLYFFHDVLGLNSHSSTKTSWHATGFVTKIGVILITLATTATHGLTVFHIPILNGPQSFFSTQGTQRDTCNLYSSSSLQKKPKQQSRHISFELPNHLAKAFWGWGGPNVYEVKRMQSRMWWAGGGGTRKRGKWGWCKEEEEEYVGGLHARRQSVPTEPPTVGSGKETRRKNLRNFDPKEIPTEYYLSINGFVQQFRQRG